MPRKSRITANNHHSTATKPQPRAAAANLVRQPAEEFVEQTREYARQRPEVLALWCLGIGFVLGWKLKPW